MLKAPKLNRLITGALLLSLLCQTPLTNTGSGRDLAVATAQLGASAALVVICLLSYIEFSDRLEILFRAQKPRLPEYASIPRNISAKEMNCVVALLCTAATLYGAYYFGKTAVRTLQSY